MYHAKSSLQAIFYILVFVYMLSTLITTGIFIFYVFEMLLQYIYATTPKNFILY